jgi:hypothetical protein
MTGVPMMPTSEKLAVSRSEPGTVVTPSAGLIRLVAQSGMALGPRLLSASKA